MMSPNQSRQTVHCRIFSLKSRGATARTPGRRFTENRVANSARVTALQQTRWANSRSNRTRSAGLSSSEGTLHSLSAGSSENIGFPRRRADSEVELPELQVRFSLDQAQQIEGHLARVIVAPHGGLPRRNPGVGGDGVPSVGAVIHRVEDQALM